MLKHAEKRATEVWTHTSQRSFGVCNNVGPIEKHNCLNSLYVLIYEVKRKVEKPSLHVLFMCLSFIRCLRYISLETFSHFKNSLAISEIIGLVQSRLHVQGIFFSFSFFFSHAFKLPKRSPSLFLLLLTMCQYVHVSNNNNKTVWCEWLRSHFGLVPYKIYYNEVQLDTKSGLVQFKLSRTISFFLVSYYNEITIFNWIYCICITLLGFSLFSYVQFCSSIQLFVCIPAYLHNILFHLHLPHCVFVPIAVKVSAFWHLSSCWIKSYSHTK